MSANTHTTTQNKELFLAALKKTRSIVTYAAELCGLPARTHYDWLKADPEYKKAVEEVGNEMLDFVENAAYKRVDEGSDKMIEFILKTKGKKRGYGNELDITSGGEPIIFNMNLIKNIDDIPKEDNDDKDN